MNSHDTHTTKTTRGLSPQTRAALADIERAEWALDEQGNPYKRPWRVRNVSHLAEVEQEIQSLERSGEAKLRLKILRWGAKQFMAQNPGAPVVADQD